MNNKKAVISGEMIMIIPKMIFLIAVMFAFIILIKVLIITKMDVRSTEAVILTNKILFTPEGILYFDKDTGRVYPGIIDLDKFRELSEGNPNSLDDVLMSYGSGNPIISAKITLEMEAENVVAYYNKEKFDRWEPRALPDIKGGPGSVKSFRKLRYVLVEEGGVLSPATLNFLIIS